MFDLNQLYRTTAEDNSAPVKESNGDSDDIIFTKEQTTLHNFVDFGSTSTSNTYYVETFYAILGGSTITAKKHIVFDAFNFSCDQSTLTAPDIYLPEKDSCEIADDCNLVGTVHYGEAMPPLPIK